MQIAKDKIKSAKDNCCRWLKSQDS